LAVQVKSQQRLDSNEAPANIGSTKVAQLGLQWKGDFAGSFFSNQPQPFPLETLFVIHGFVVQCVVTSIGCGAVCSTV
jgi:hypothetical protein